jgi:RNA polymerase sigma-70 factor (ECF subfamily)
MQTAMNAYRKSFIPTRRSLLERLKNLEDEASWKDFFETYWKLIYCVALKAGLRPADAEDVVQETVITVAKTIEKYRYNPDVTFKGWLHHLVRIKVANFFRRQGRQPLLLDDVTLTRDGDVSKLEHIANPEVTVLDAVWEEEWQKNLIEAALERLKSRVKTQHYQAFYLHIIKGQSVAQVAHAMNVSRANVYLIRHRLKKLFEKAVAQVQKGQRS